MGTKGKYQYYISDYWNEVTKGRINEGSNLLNMNEILSKMGSWHNILIQTSDPEFYFETHMESILDNLLLHEQHSGYLTTLLLYTHIVTRTGCVPTGRFDGTSTTSSLSKRFLLTGFPE